MSKLKALLVGTFFMLASAAHANDTTYRVTESPGGHVLSFVQKYNMLAEEGALIIIDGECASACTLFLGLVPKGQVCVTPKAELGFHSASMITPFGLPIYSAEGTRMIWALYPTEVRKYLIRRGWDGQSEHSDLITIKGKALTKLVRPCTEKESN